MRELVTRCCVLVCILCPALIAPGVANEFKASIYPVDTLKPVDSRLEVKLGDSAPDFTLPSVQGDDVKLSRYRGDKNVVLSFVHLMGVYPPGSLLRLRNGTTAMVIAPAPDPDGIPGAVVVRDAAGTLLEEPEELEYTRSDIAEPLTPAAAGIDTAALLQRAGVVIDAV